MTEVLLLLWPKAKSIGNRLKHRRTSDLTRPVVMVMKKEGQVWVETVVYTLIAFVLIGLVLSFAKPKNISNFIPLSLCLFASSIPNDAIGDFLKFSST